MPSQGQVFVTVPIDLFVALPLSLTGLGPHSSTSFNQTSRTISITNALPTGAPAQTLVTFTIASGIVNPASAKKSGVFVLGTADSAGNLID